MNEICVFNLNTLIYLIFNYYCCVAWNGSAVCLLQNPPAHQDEEHGRHTPPGTPPPPAHQDEKHGLDLQYSPTPGSESDPPYYCKVFRQIDYRRTLYKKHLK